MTTCPAADSLLYRKAAMGEAVVTYRTVKIGNQEVRRELARDVVSQPVPQVVEVGTGKNLMVEQAVALFGTAAREPLRLPRIPLPRAVEPV